MVKKYFKRKLKFNKQYKKKKQIYNFMGGSVVKRVIEVEGPVVYSCQTAGTASNVNLYNGSYTSPVYAIDLLQYLNNTTYTNPFTSKEYRMMGNVYTLSRMTGMTITYYPVVNQNSTGFGLNMVSCPEFSLSPVLCTTSYIGTHDLTLAQNNFSRDNSLYVNPMDTTPVSKTYWFPKVMVLGGTYTAINGWTDPFSFSNGDLMILLGFNSYGQCVSGANVTFNIGRVVIKYYTEWAQPYPRRETA